MDWFWKVILLAVGAILITIVLTVLKVGMTAIQIAIYKRCSDNDYTIAIDRTYPYFSDIEVAVLEWLMDCTISEVWPMEERHPCITIIEPKNK